eukprot:2543201-Prymnesium_polylepis.2
MGLSNFGSAAGEYLGSGLLYAYGGVRKPGFEHLGAYVATRSAMRVLPALLVPCLVPRGTPADTAKEVRRLALHAARRARRVPPAVYTDGATCLGLSR